MKPAAARQPISVRLDRTTDGPVIRILVPVRTAPLATERNRIRRRIREAIRTLDVRIPPGLRATFVVHGTDLPPYNELKELLVLIMRKSAMVHR